MSLEIMKVVNSNKPDEEFVRLKATKDVNLKNYVIVDNTYIEGKVVSNIHRHIFRFPDMNVKKNEYVRLYTGKGTAKSEKNNKDAIVHYLYWGMHECIWNDTGDVAELLEVKSIHRKGVAETE